MKISKVTDYAALTIIDFGRPLLKSSLCGEKLISRYVMTKQSLEIILRNFNLEITI